MLPPETVESASMLCSTPISAMRASTPRWNSDARKPPPDFLAHEVFHDAYVPVCSPRLLALAGFSFMSFAWAVLAGNATLAILALAFHRDLSIFRLCLSKWRRAMALGAYSGAWGIRALVDTVRISLRNVPDSHARPRR